MGHVHALMDRQKPGFTVFPAADSHFSKATLRRNRPQSLAVATAAVTIAILPFFPLFFFFFVFRFLFLCLSLGFSLVFPLLCPSITSQFRQTAWKTTTHDLWGALCAVLFPETFGQLRWTICGFVPTLGQLRLKNIGWLSLCDSLRGNEDIKFLGCFTFKSLDLHVSWHDNLAIT